MDNYCPICNNPLQYLLKKGDTDYMQCESCRTIFCNELDQDNKVGGQHEEGRALQNDIRLDRVEKMLGSIGKENARILDYGTGNGFLVDYLNEHGWKCDGFDPYNPKYSRIPNNGIYDLVTMIEVVEHTVAPFMEIDFISRKLKSGAGLYIETGFFDIAVEDNIPLNEYIYIEPSAGHSTIFSHHGLDYMLLLKGYRTKRHFDRNVRLYQKIK